jgi:hypothetical protein
MAIFKRGRIYWYHFWFSGTHVQESTKLGNPRVACQMEAACRTALAKGEVGIVERKPVPTLRQFSQRFIDAISVRCAAKPNTVKFYEKKMDRLLDFDFLAGTPIDRIDEALIESFIQERSLQVSPASVNRELATLRRALRLAQQWKVILRVPRLRLLPGERNREFVLGRAHSESERIRKKTLACYSFRYIRSCNREGCAVNYAESTVPGWRNGIRGGLKNHLGRFARLRSWTQHNEKREV